jgi:hypothetical protein
MCFSHRIAAHLDPVRIVDQSVQNAVCDGRIADLLVPARYRYPRLFRTLTRHAHTVSMVA